MKLVQIRGVFFLWEVRPEGGGGLERRFKDGVSDGMLYALEITGMETFSFTVTQIGYSVVPQFY